MVQPPDFAEALRHDSVASGQRPDSAWFHFMVASDYAGLGSYDRAIAAYRKVIAMSPFYTGIAHLWMGEALSKKKDWEAAIAAIREAIRLLPERGSQMFLTSAYLALGKALAGAGRHAEAREEMLSALHQNSTLVEVPRYYFRYNTACYAMNCADGKGINTPAPAERT